MWTITSRPADYPAVPFVIRVQHIGASGSVDGGVVGQASSLAEARRRVADLGGNVNMGRADEDPPVIVEVWV